MVPVTFANFFVASTSAGAALVGLLFVAVSIAPERTVALSAPSDRRVLATSVYLALVNAFFVSLAALIPSVNIGTGAVVMAVIGIVNSLNVGIQVGHRLLREPQSRRGHLTQLLPSVLISLLIYGAECFYAINVIRDPRQSASIYALAFLLVALYGFGLARAWELLGAQRADVLGLLGLLRSLEPTTSETTNAVSATPGRDRAGPT